MKTKNTIYALFGTALLTLSACSDFLEPKSQSEYVPRDVNALQEMLIGEAYPTSSGGEPILAYANIFDDDLQFCKVYTDGYDFDESNKANSEITKALFTWQPDVFVLSKNKGISVSNIWKGYYELILGANAALDYLDDVSGSEEEKNYVKAQALALRGFYYFMLVNYYGAPYNYNKEALGVPLKLSSELLPDENILLKRNTVAEVYDQILKDLNESENLFLNLPKSKQYQPDYLVSLPMLELLKSRVYLYMNNWKDAEKYAEKVINDWSFKLLDLNDLPEPSRSEPYYTFTSIDNPEAIWLYGKISDFMSNSSGYVSKSEEDPWWGMKITYNRDLFIASDELLNSFADGDLRKDRYIVKEWDNNDNQFISNSYTVFGKFKITATGAPGSTNNMALSFRLSEAYLNLAEAAAESGETQDAIEAMKILLSKRYETDKFVAPSELSGEELINFVRNERRKELCFEGQRWFDLRRYGMPKITHTWAGQTFTLQKNDASYTMPIDEETLEQNKALEQNPLAPKREI